MLTPTLIYMRNILFSVLAAVSLHGLAQHDHHQTQTNSKVTSKSPRTAAMAMVGNNHVHIDYGSPSVRGRTIWNGLVAYGQVWVTGAHKATWIAFSEDVKINSQIIPKGKYGLFTIPDKNEWTIIINKDWDMHLADDYKPENDVIRIKASPRQNDAFTESLTYTITALDNKKGASQLRGST